MKFEMICVLIVLALSVTVNSLEFTGCVIDGKLVDKDNSDPNNRCMTCNPYVSESQYTPVTNGEAFLSGFGKEGFDGSCVKASASNPNANMRCVDGKVVMLENLSMPQGTKCGCVDGCKMSVCDGKGHCVSGTNVPQGASCTVDICKFSKPAKNTTYPNGVTVTTDQLSKTKRDTCGPAYTTEESFRALPPEIQKRCAELSHDLPLDITEYSPCYENPIGTCDGRGMCVFDEIDRAIQPRADGEICGRTVCGNMFVCSSGKCIAGEGKYRVCADDIPCRKHVGFRNYLIPGSGGYCLYENLEDGTECESGTCVGGVCTSNWFYNFWKKRF